MSKTHSYTLQFSHTMISAFDNCPESMRQQYITKKFKRAFTPQITNGVDAHAELDKRVKREATLPPPLQNAEKFVQALERHGAPESEVALGVNHFWEPVSFWDGWLRGKFDVIVRNHSTRKALVGDWKTGKVYEKADQLAIGAHLLMQSDPEIDTVVGMNFWLAADQIGAPYTFTRGDGVTARLTKKLRDIEARKMDVEWEKRQGPLCAYCPVVICQHHRGN